MSISGVRLRTASGALAPFDGSIATIPPRHEPLWLVAVAMTCFVPGIGWASMNVPGEITRLP